MTANHNWHCWNILGSSRLSTATGEPGLTGHAGLQSRRSGPRSPTGEPGLAARRGLPSESGRSGPRSPTGEPRLTGHTGLPGKSRRSGPRSPTGEPGPPEGTTLRDLRGTRGNTGLLC